MVGGFFNGDLVAYSWLSHQKAFMSDIKKWVDFDRGYVWRGATKEKKRYRGIGVELLRYSLKLAEAQGEKEVYALTDIDNIHTQRALESTGFQKQKIVSYSTFFNLERRSERTMEKDEVV
jgi:ribosomal protein S18 acetylase RimI-like enzyme